MKTIEAMIREAGGLEAVRENYIRVENEPLMRLCVEVVAGPFRVGTYEISVAHYGAQNGDPMRDPEMTFLVMPMARGWVWMPLTWRNDYVGSERRAGAYDQDGVYETAFEREEREQAALARQWDSNLARQGFFDAFRRAKQASNGTPMSPATNGGGAHLAGS